MNTYKADLHIHTVLSPCGSLEMSPVKIVAAARQKGLNIIGITDHNSTLHCRLTRQLAEKEGILVLSGTEITTREEVHCLSFFENDDQLSEFQQYLDNFRMQVKNDTAYFGYQLVVDEHEHILAEIDELLIAAIDQSIEEIEKKVHALDGLFIPAHIERPAYSIMSQLGFIPAGLVFDALEVASLNNLQLLQTIAGEERIKSLLRNSDAHHLEQIGERYSMFEMEECSFSEIRKALHNEQGRKVVLQ